MISSPGRVTPLEHHATHWKVGGLIPSQDTYGRQPVDVYRCFGFVCFFFSLSFLLSLKSINIFLKISNNHWLVWLSGLSTDLRTKGLPVQFPAKGTCLCCRPGPSWGHARDNHTLMFPSPLFLPLFLYL